MNAKERYESAREIYGAIGVDTEAAMEQLRNIPISMHCWQGDDVMGFEGAQALSGGIRQPAIIRAVQEIPGNL